MIDMQHIFVRYGDLVALNDLTLHLDAGEVFGYIGPNGAGKSTTMKVLACLLTPSSGSASVDGHNVRTQGDAVRRIVGYMPDFLGVYDDLTVDEYLQFFAGAFAIKRSKRRAIVDGVLELTDLTFKQHALVDSLSRGMQQRLGIARVLLHDPKVLLLDEPASGLDPRARIEIRSLLGELRQMGKTIVVSSHILSELHEMCTSIGIIERGELLFAGTLEEAFHRAGAGARISVTLDRNADTLTTGLEQDERVHKVVAEETQLHIELVPGQHDHHFLIESLMNAGGRIVAFEPRSHKLEDVFLRLTKGSLQ